jgi:hypothetical protein
MRASGSAMQRPFAKLDNPDQEISEKLNVIKTEKCIRGYKIIRI